MGLLRIPGEMKQIMARPSLRGATQSSRGIDITASVTDTIIVCVQPHADGEDAISFEEFQCVVERHDDAVSRRFARSLAAWAGIPAGQKR